MRKLDDAGRLRMFISETSSGEVGSIAVFGMDMKRAYYLYGANDPAQRNNPHWNCRVMGRVPVTLD